MNTFPFGLVFFLLHLGQSDGSCRTDFSVKNTANWNLTSFTLPVSETIALAMWSNLSTNSDVQINGSLQVDGQQATRWQCFSQLMLWTLIFIRRTEIDAIPCASSKLFIPEDMQKVTGRSIAVSSDDLVQWQLFPLPLEEKVIKTTSNGNFTEFDLAESENVIVFRQVSSSLSFMMGFYIDNVLVVEENITDPLVEQWSSMSFKWFADFKTIYISHKDQTRFLRYNYSLEEDSPNRRSVGVSSEYLVQWQLLSLPLKTETVTSVVKEQPSENFWKTVTLITAIAFLCLFLITTLPLSFYVYYLRKGLRNKKAERKETFAMADLNSAIEMPRRTFSDGCQGVPKGCHHLPTANADQTGLDCGGFPRRSSNNSAYDADDHIYDEIDESLFPPINRNAYEPSPNLRNNHPTICFQDSHGYEIPIKK